MSQLDGIEGEVEASQTEAELREALRRAHRALDELKGSRAELVEAVYRAGKDAAAAFPDQPIPPAPLPDKRRGASEVAVATLGDWQWGKVTPSYSSDVARERVELYGDLLLQDVEERRQVIPVRDLRVWCLGDMVEGELIFPGQAHRIDASLYRQVFDAGATFRDFLRRMGGHFRRVEVVGIIGNHGAIGGRSRRDMNPEANADRFMYRHVAEVLEGRPQAPQRFTIPEGHGESSWYFVDRIGAYGSLLFHGYNLRGHAGFPWYGLGKKVGGWALGAIEEFRIADEGDLDVDFGHFHQPTRVTLNRVTARCVGSTESHNTFAQEQLAAVGRPAQGLRFVDPKRGRVTWERVVYLDEAAR